MPILATITVVSYIATILNLLAFFLALGIWGAYVHPLLWKTVADADTVSHKVSVYGIPQHNDSPAILQSILYTYIALALLSKQLLCIISPFLSVTIACRPPFTCA